MEKESLIYIDGEFYPKSEAKISVYDHGLLYGDGVFEGIRAYNGTVFKLKEHIDRLYKSAHAIMLQIPMTKTEMIRAIIETLKKNNFKDAYIRLVVTRGVGDLGLDPRKCPKPTVIIIAGAIKLVEDKAKEKGITTTITWVRRNPADATPPGVKSLNYLNNVLAKIEANNAGADEAICLNGHGFVSEGVGENIFVVKYSENMICTPPNSSGALDGITKGVIKELSKKLGHLIVEKDITPNELFNADEVFFTGTAAEIMPVREVNKRIIGEGKPGPVTESLMKEFSRIITDPRQGTPIDSII